MSRASRPAARRTVEAGALAALLGFALSCGRAPQRTGIEAAIADVEAGRRTTPLVAESHAGGDATVTFLVESRDGRVPRIVSDVTGWGERTADDSFDVTVGRMARVGSTDWYRLDAQVAAGARIEYLTVLGETYAADPHNPRRAAMREPPASELVTSGWAPPPELTEAPVAARGRTAAATLDSAALGGPRRLIVYTPPGYRDDAAYPVAVFHDGLAAAEAGEAPRVLDWRIAHGSIAPIVAVFLQSRRAGEIVGGEDAPMRTFLDREVPAWIAAHYAVSRRPADWAILAISYGAKDALDAALAPGAPYGRLGLLIPGRRIRSADLDAFLARRSPALRVAILAGRYDAANLETARAASRALAAAGHAVDYREVPEGHSPATWRNHLGEVFVSLFGAGRPGRS